MWIVFDMAELSQKKPATLQDLFGGTPLQFIVPTTPGGVQIIPNQPPGFDWVDVVDLTLPQVREFAEGCHAETVAGLRVFAEEGPIIRASKLNAAGIANYRHFQGRVTKRTRTITKNRHAFLLGWDDWSTAENQAAGCGHYGVTAATHKSLREFFGLD
ncbi:hypothetical protein G3576_28445 [Roseomonas stagni]|uniref:Uncharacterized protein n=1 Tax=Falsiroseomonas algicola TaxID=2716930 RepID=A0A6M1LU33_9PROT|nr:hypothetical protein [Falsiroseomonas algicola]NGM23970.1 hypothetical protein [Falsiroseomonas algicola]